MKIKKTQVPTQHNWAKSLLKHAGKSKPEIEWVDSEKGKLWHFKKSTK